MIIVNISLHHWFTEGDLMYEQEKHELQKVIQTIRESVPLQKIYLFGSFARGNPHDSSDLDLCILTDELKGRKIDTIRKIRRSLVKDVSMPIDLLIYTSNEFNERAKLSSTFEHQILKEGVLVYGS